VVKVCESVGKNPSLSVVESMLGVYRGTPMAPCIEARIEELRRQKGAIAAPSPAPSPEAPETSKTAVEPAPAPDGPEVKAARAAALKCCYRAYEIYDASTGGDAEFSRKICRASSLSELYALCDFHKHKFWKDLAAKTGRELSACTCPPKPPQTETKAPPLTYADGIKCCVDGMVMLTGGTSSREELAQSCRRTPGAESPTTWKNWCDVLRIDKAMAREDALKRSKKR
jgi:hypothetical protein